MISIIMPVYNAEKYLKKSIESILKQTYPNWEMIIVDNGSTDDSLGICRAYASRDVRIQVLHQYHNRGVSVARNLGMEKACGKFLTFIDADDWIEADYLERLIKAQKETQTDMLVCEYKKVFDSDREEKETAFEKRSAPEEKVNEKETRKYSTKVYNTKDYIENCLLSGYTHCWGVLYTTSLIEQLKFPVGMTIGEDMLFLIDAVLNAGKIVVTDYAGYQYYINQNGAMNQKFQPSYMDQILCWQKAKEKIMSVYPTVEDKLDSILVVSAMLVAGKLSDLRPEELKEYQKEFEECHKVVKEHGSRREVIKLLPAGYSIKVKIFKSFPKGYMKLYYIWKNKRRN